MDRGKQFMQNFFREDPCQQDADYKILIAHGVVEGLAYSGLSVNDVPIPLDALGLFDFAFLGHIHDAQLITERGSGRVVGCYPGGVAKLDFGEEKSKQGFWIVDLDSKPVTPQFHTFVHQKPLTTIVFQNKPSVEEIRNLENVSGFVRIILKEGDLVTVQHLYDLPPVVSVELEPKEPIEEGARHQTFSSMEEAFAKYVDLQKVDDPLKARLVETFSYYMSKVKDNEEQA
jgi:exonuclease SbcD